MTETITANYIGVDERWDARQLPHAFDAETTISAWTTDDDLDEQANALAAVYATDGDDLHDLLHALRSHLRVAALDAASPSPMTEAVAIVGSLDHLISADSTDAELSAYAAAAEAGAGGPVPDLLAELTVLRDAERADRVFVADAGAPRIANLGDAEWSGRMDPNTYDAEDIRSEGDYDDDDEERDR
jgi:hypothetical protein